MPIILKDPVFNNETNSADDGLFTDLLFDGQTKELNIALELEEKIDYIDKLEVWLYNITRATYNYNISYNIYESASGNPFVSASSSIQQHQQWFWNFWGCTTQHIFH